MYAALLSESGQDVTVFARGRRLESLRECGLRYRKGNEVRTAPVHVLSALDPDDRYDFVLLTVRENQIRKALGELKANCSPTIATMV